ncbi:hypothetical protein ACVA6F_19475, partial [Bacillus altitudinis]
MHLKLSHYLSNQYFHFTHNLQEQIAKEKSTKNDKRDGEEEQSSELRDKGKDQGDGAPLHR